ncbi:hypothetical protein FRC12_022055 [Ceratobasidium sp. 428]|nr:hypothetical protein FRC12_022055 [Ceratobasidium sp. 428]
MQCLAYSPMHQSTILDCSVRKLACSQLNVSHHTILAPILIDNLVIDYSKLPKVPTVDKVFVVDPLIATGGTAVAAVHMILDWGIPLKDIKFLGILASQAGLNHVKSEFPDLEIWFAAVDDELTQAGLIKPGLGDTGDRLYSTIH